MCKNECLLGYLEVLRQTLEIYCIPISFYPNKYSVFFPPKKYNLDELLCVRFDRIIDNAGIFSIKNSKFQVMDRSLPPKTKIQIYLSEKIGMRVKANNKIYDVQPLELISKGKIDNNSLDYHQWLANVVIELINEYYLKDAKAS